MIKIICGLGNPGTQYRSTRHNLGFEVVDKFVLRHETARFDSGRYFDSCRLALKGETVYVIKPSTFMNRSGLAVREALKDFGAGPTELFVINDDFHLPLGSLRIRKAGSAGGHRGLESIIDEIGTNDFPRLRMGIGPLPADVVHDHDARTRFLLEPFGTEETEIVEEMLARAVEATVTVVNEGLDLAINIYNRTNPAPED